MTCPAPDSIVDAEGVVGRAQHAAHGRKAGGEPLRLAVQLTHGTAAELADRRRVAVALDALHTQTPLSCLRPLLAEHFIQRDADASREVERPNLRRQDWQGDEPVAITVEHARGQPPGFAAEDENDIGGGAHGSVPHQRAPLRGE
jgi:hypothetical protein